MTDIFIVIVLLTLSYIVYKVNEINTRLRITDLRQRVLERLNRFEDWKYEESYNFFFGELETKDYDKLIRFSRQHSLQLPLRTIAEDEARVKRLSQTEEGIKQLELEKEAKGY